MKEFQKSLFIVALGIVYGDIGTNPLYMVKECLNPQFMNINSESILGVISLIIWLFILIVSYKYLFIVLKADNKGEGGALSLFALLKQSLTVSQKKPIFYLTILASALFYGDGIITPAISVLSAIEGLSVISSFYAPYIVPISAFILLLLFCIQKKGTQKIGGVFGKIMLCWFLTIAILGLKEVVKEPQILASFNPLFGIRFLSTLIHSPTSSLVSFVHLLGSIILAVTGVEVLYADLGHLNRRSILRSWFFVVFPSLTLNCLGQGAVLLQNPANIVNPFYKLCPTSFLPFLVILSTIATIIASQAVISGVFSITKQAIQLGLLPRMRLLNTSEDHFGQIFIPLINWLLGALTLMLVIFFRTASNLAQAYGLAVSMTMILTTILIFYVTKIQWHWTPLQISLRLGPIFFIEFFLVLGSFFKILHGGWITLSLAGIIFYIIVTWIKGVDFLQKGKTMPSIKHFLESPVDVIRIQGTGVYLCSEENRIPTSFYNNIRFFGVLHETICFLHFNTVSMPRASEEERYDIEKLYSDVYRIKINFGYMEIPNILQFFKFIKNEKRSSLDSFYTNDPIIFFTSRKIAISSQKKALQGFQEKLFCAMCNNSERATDFFKLSENFTFEQNIRIKI
jgi:KUP system potassium uptake protein